MSSSRMLVVQTKDALVERKAKPPQKPVHQTMPEPFIFVPITKSEASKGRGAAKRIVRAHVTRVQHAKSSTLAGVDLQSWTVKPYIHRDSITVKRKPKNKKPAAKKSTNPDEEPQKSPSEDVLSTTSSRDSSVESKIPRLVENNAAQDPFWTFAVDYSPNIAPIFAHYISNIAVDIPDIDTGRKGRLRRELFPLCMTDAATMWAVLLMGASHYCVVNPSKGALIDLLAIKARALSEINTALADPKKATTDAIIMAVAKMAAYESIFGDSAHFTAHMRGLQMMLKLRGGLSQLGLNGLMERMCVWIDLNGCHLTGINVHLGTEEYPTTVQFAAPDPFHFAGIS